MMCFNLMWLVTVFLLLCEKAGYGWEEGRAVSCAKRFNVDVSEYDRELQYTMKQKKIKRYEYRYL